MARQIAAASSLPHDGKGPGEDEPASSEHKESSQVMDIAASDRPKVHLRTYIVVASMWILFFVQLNSLYGPPTVLSYIGTQLHDPQRQYWVTVSISLVQAVLAPLFAFASDVFQARKAILVFSCTVALVGACIAPGSQDVYRLIAAQSLIGVGLASMPLTYAVPSEVMPRKWRPMVQAGMNCASSLGAIFSPLVIGGMTKADEGNGWRNFYWLQAGMWGFAGIGIFCGYHPPKRPTQLDHLSWWRKLGYLDLPGFGLLTAGLCLFLTGMNLGGAVYPWHSARVLTTLIAGLVAMAAFVCWEWKGTAVGILHHDLFAPPRGRTFVICTVLILLEGAVLFSIVIFYPAIIARLWTTDPLQIAARLLPFWGMALASTFGWGYWSTRFKTVREPMFAGFLIFTASIVGFATIQQDHSTISLVLDGLAGIGFGAPFILVVTGVQLSVPHKVIATGSAVVTTARSIGTTVFTVIYSTVLSNQMSSKLPSYIGSAARRAGLVPTSVPAFITAITSNNRTAMDIVPGSTPEILQAGALAAKEAYVDSVRVVYIIAAPIGVVAVVLSLFLGDLRKAMDDRIDAPIERAGKELSSRHVNVRGSSSP